MATPAVAGPRLEETPSQRLMDGGIAAAAFAASLALLAVGDAEVFEDGGAALVGAVLLVALSSLPLVAGRRAPLAVFVVTAVASSALRLIAVPAGPPIGATVALFGLAAAGDGSRARSRLTLAVAVGMLALHATAAGIAEGRFPGPELLFGTLLWGAAWLAGDRARLRVERMAELEDRAVQAERQAESERRLAAAEERTRIARDLHDSAGHAINVILVHAGAGRLRASSDPHAARDAFATIEDVARETVGEIDQLVGSLRERRPGEPDERVKSPVGIAALETLVERHRLAGVDVTASVTGRRRPLPPAVDRSAYRIIQEALTNAARHGEGSVQLDIVYGDDALEITAVNSVPPGTRRRPDSGHGLVGMRERAASLGGSIDVRNDGGSFALSALLPLPSPAT